MKAKAVFFIFVMTVLLYFAAMAFHQDTLLLITKPLLITSLSGYFLIAAGAQQSAIKWCVAAALAFSVAGDTLLMLAPKNERFFLAGLLAFLAAHLFYIISFHKIRIRENIEGKWQWAVAVAIYYFFIMGFLLPHTGSMKIPVIVYGLVISFMLFVAALLYDLADNKTARFLLTGALLFVVSDSILAVNKFHHPVKQAGWVIMITYLAAQLFIVQGVIRYLAYPIAQDLKN